MNRIVAIEPEKYWFSVLPSSWQTGRIKDVYNQISNIGSNLDEGAYIPLENLESFTGKLNQRVNNENNETTNLFRTGDILLNKLRPYLAKIHLAEFNGGVSGEVIVLRNSTIWKRNTSNKYFFYRFLSSTFIDKINSMSEGVKMPRTNPSKILALDIAIPSLEEQTAIAEYLDTKTQAIDKKVSLLEKKVGYYLELRKSLINETVTKGLDKNVKLKDSGIDWIGKIPKHWEVKRGKDFFKEISRKNRPDLPLLAASQKQGVVLKSMLENRSMEAQKSFEIFKWVKPKDFVISLRSFEGGIETAFYEGIISPAYTVFNFRANGNITSYFTHLFKSVRFIDFLQSSITGIRDGQSVKFIELERAFFAVPPVSEQEQIADYLAEKTSKIDQIITNIQTQIATLKELRKTLVNDVVTGKIKV